MYLLKKQAQGCIVDVIIPTNFVCVRFDPAIPTFNYIIFILVLVRDRVQGHYVF